MAQRTPLGKHFYLWHPTGQPAANDILLISAHGSQTFSSARVPVPTGSSVNFIGPRDHGVLVEPSVEYFAKKTGVQLPESVDRGSVENYNLSKFQKPGVRTSANNLPYEDSYDRLFSLSDSEMLTKSTDVVTIRNRFDVLQRDPTLKDLFNDLQKVGRSYSGYIYYFCRNSWKPWQSKPDYVAQYL